MTVVPGHELGRRDAPLEVLTGDAERTIGLRADAGRFAGAFDFRVIGQQFDDDRNDFLLQHGSLADARGAWRVAKGVEVFGAIENAFNEDLDTGRTPIRTVGQPRIGRVGLNFRF